jgi:uncharacterized phiE125 gp8 family phage protein
MKITVVTPPGALPITEAEAVEYCKLYEDDFETAILNQLISAMTEYAEHLTGRSFVERTLMLSLDYFPSCIDLPHAPLMSVTKIEYLDSNNSLQTFPASNYEVDTVAEPGILRLKSGVSAPSIGDEFNPVRITYIAGYDANGDLTNNSYLPQTLRTWIMQRISTLYDNRHEFVEGHIIQSIPRSYADALLDQLKMGSRIF